jgi:hypothetical protein
VPSASPLVLNVATPELSVAVPRLVTPSRKATFPVGVPAVLLTVAVNVATSPK